MPSSSSRPTVTPDRSWPPQLEIWLKKLAQQAQSNLNTGSTVPRILSATESKDDTNTIIITIAREPRNNNGDIPTGFLHVDNSILRSKEIYDWEERSGRKGSLIGITPFNTDLTAVEKTQINPFCYLTEALADGEKDSGMISYNKKVSWRVISGDQGTDEIWLTVKSAVPLSG